MGYFTFASAALLLAAASVACAQVDTAATSSPAPEPKVVRVVGTIEADNLIEVYIDHLGEWVSAKNDPSKLVPFINGLELRGNYPDGVHLDRGQNHLHYHLRITPANKDAWINLLGAAQGLIVPVTFRVGLERQTPLDTVFESGNTLPLVVIDPYYGVVAVVVIAGMLIVFVRLAQNTNLIRDHAPKTDSDGLRPYSLGRTQMAFWFLLICSSYIAIWLITGALDTITASLLGMMGISAGTALGETMIDADRMDRQSQQPAGDPLVVTVPRSVARSRGFIRDILSGGADYSLQRFQIAVWTIVLGIMFVSSVYNSLTMPDFSATLLGLMGISSGTYIGFKFPER